MTTIDENTLQQQIVGITDFQRELVAGSGAKGVMSAIGAQSRDLYQVPVSAITVLDGLNPRIANRMYLEGVQALSEDIERLGFWQDKPLAGYIAKIDGKDTVVLQDGHRRLAAVKMAIERGVQIEKLPMVLKDKSQSMVDLTLALLHSNEGVPFNMYEKAILAKRLKGYGWENKDIAAEMRCTTVFVGQLLTLAGSPQAIQELVKAGNLSGTEAIDIVKEHGEDAVEVANQKVAAAAAKGNKKATKKDALTPAERRAKRAKTYGYELYKIANKLLLPSNKKVVDAMPTELYTELDTIMTAIEKDPPKKAVKEPKAPKATAAKKPAAKKLAPWDQPKKPAKAKK